MEVGTTAMLQPQEPGAEAHPGADAAMPFTVQEAAFEHVQESVDWSGGATMPWLAPNEEQETGGGAETKTEACPTTVPSGPVQVREYDSARE